MPKVSNKSDIQELLLYCGFQTITDSQYALLEEDEVMYLQGCVESQRYAVEHPSVGIKIKPRWWQDALFSTSYNLNNFKTHFRMTRESFWNLCQMLEGDPKYQETRVPVHLQIAVALYRFGCFGNASALQHIATKFGVSEGSVVLFTDRVIGILTSMSKQFIRWPDTEERKSIGESMALNLLPKCMGFVDGSDAPFHCAPLDNKEVYWSRKKKYCMQFQIVCDPDKRIRDLFVGFPGSVHDSKVFRSCPLGMNPSNFFTTGEYIIGDSAYAISETVIVPFRRSAVGLDRKRRKFNFHISSHRVAVEHTIGMLKGRFQSLRGLRIMISNDSGHQKACEWIHACAILHNYLLETDKWEELAIGDAQPDETDNDNQEINTIPVSGHDKRQALLDIFWAMNT